jgi:hypothetical protein
MSSSPLSSFQLADVRADVGVQLTTARESASR